MLPNCRWLIRRLQGFASIKCDTYLDSTSDPHALLILVAKLSGAFTEAIDLTILLTIGAGHELWACSMPLPSCLCISARMKAFPRTL